MDTIKKGFTMFMDCIKCGYAISYNTKVKNIQCPKCLLDYKEVV